MIPSLLRAIRRHSGCAVTGPARPLPARSDLDRDRSSQARHRIPVPARSDRHHHPGGRLVFHAFAALAEFIRELVIDGTNEGLAAARARGQRLGRPLVMATHAHQAKAIRTRPEETVSSVARLLGVSRSTIYKYVPELGDGSRASNQQPPRSPHHVASKPAVTQGVSSERTYSSAHSAHPYGGPKSLREEVWQMSDDHEARNRREKWKDRAATWSPLVFSFARWVQDVVGRLLD